MMCSLELAPAAWRSLGDWRVHGQCCGLWGQEHSTKSKASFSRQGGPSCHSGWGQQHWRGTRDAEEAPHRSPAVHKEQELLRLLWRKVRPYRLLQQPWLQLHERLKLLSSSTERLGLFEVHEDCMHKCNSSSKKHVGKTVELGKQKLEDWCESVNVIQKINSSSF